MNVIHKYEKRWNFEINQLKDQVGTVFRSVNFDEKFNLNVEINGPAESPYETQIYMVQLNIQKFPIGAPSIKFITKIWNPDVNFQTGEICDVALNIDALTWKPSVTLDKIFQTLISLMMVPRSEGSVNGEAAKMVNDKPVFIAKVRSTYRP